MVTDVYREPDYSDHPRRDVPNDHCARCGVSERKEYLYITWDGWTLCGPCQTIHEAQS